MNAEASKSKRTYDRRLRDSQASQTRERILASLAEQIVDAGLNDFSIEQVAKRAGVSPRTVYHHFPNREELMDAINAWLDQQAVGHVFSAEMSIDEVLDHLRTVFDMFDEHETVIRAHLVTDLGTTLRRRGRSQRRGVIETIVRREAPGADESEIRRATSLIHLLGSSETWRAMKDESGLSGKEAGEAVAWAIEVLLARLAGKEHLRGEGEKGGDDDNGG